MFARGRITLMEALSEIRAEETRLRGAGILEVPSVLAAQAPATSFLHRLFALARHSKDRSRTHYGYCNTDGHPKPNCYLKK